MLNSGPVKDFSTYDGQLQLLIDRGLIVKDRSAALSILKRISYYRLSAYSLTLRKNDLFYKGITFDNIYELYCFDADFRQLLLKYCFVVEVSFRSYISYYHSEKYGPLGYLDSQNFQDAPRHQKFLDDLEAEIKRSDDVFIEHHKKKLNGVFPFWVAIEETSYGMLSKLFKNMLRNDRNDFSHRYIGFGRAYVENWIQCCSFCRNNAAHGGRFYNRDLRSCPVRLNSKKHAGIRNTSPYAFLIAISNLLPSKDYKNNLVSDLDSLFAKYPFALKKHLGFPEQNWKNLLL